MKLVAFDTSTEACSVAVQVDDDVLSKHRLVKREHAAMLLPMLADLLSEFGVPAQDIDGVIFGQGPGSFTGLRIAAACAQGLALAADCGVYGVSTLHAMAKGCVRLSEQNSHSDKIQGADIVMSAIDARMDQIYANTYRIDDSGELSAVLEERVVGPNSYPWDKVLSASNTEQNPMTLMLCGSGAERYESVLRESLKEHQRLTIKMMNDVYPHAVDLLQLTDAQNPSIWKSAAEAQPVYVRNKVALTEAERSNAQL